MIDQQKQIDELTGKVNLLESALKDITAFVNFDIPDDSMSVCLVQQTLKNLENVNAKPSTPEAAEKAAKTGNRKDLLEYLRLRRDQTREEGLSQ